MSNRERILSALEQCGKQATSEELMGKTGMEKKRVLDTLYDLKHNGLVITKRDDVTNHALYCRTDKDYTPGQFRAPSSKSVPVGTSISTRPEDAAYYKQKMEEAHRSIVAFCERLPKLTGGRCPINLHEAWQDVTTLLQKATAAPQYTYARSSDLVTSPDKAAHLCVDHTQTDGTDGFIIVACHPVGTIRLRPEVVPMEAKS